jgi:hypothetical protein
MRFEGKAFYFVRKSSWSISEAAGAFCIGQAQKIMGGSGIKFNPSALWLAHGLGPTQPFAIYLST